MIKIATPPAVPIASEGKYIASLLDVYVNEIGRLKEMCREEKKQYRTIHDIEELVRGTLPMKFDTFWCSHLLFSL